VSTPDDPFQILREIVFTDTSGPGPLIRSHVPEPGTEGPEGPALLLTPPTGFDSFLWERYGTGGAL
jgi:hypothetical protein